MQPWIRKNYFYDASSKIKYNKSNSLLLKPVCSICSTEKFRNLKKRLKDYQVHLEFKLHCQTFDHWEIPPFSYKHK